MKADPFELPAGPGRPLTPRQQECLELLAAGYSNEEIARKLYLSRDTVRGHMNRLYDRLGVREQDSGGVCRVRAANIGRELGLLPSLVVDESERKTVSAVLRLDVAVPDDVELLTQAIDRAIDAIREQGLEVNKR